METTMELNNSTVKRVFKQILPNPNIMTPDILDYIRVGDYGIELSLGSDFTRNKIFGVTVINLVTKKQLTSLCTLCFSLSEAMSYIKDLMDN